MQKKDKAASSIDKAASPSMLYFLLASRLNSIVGIQDQGVVMNDSMQYSVPDWEIKKKSLYQWPTSPKLLALE